MAAAVATVEPAAVRMTVMAASVTPMPCGVGESMMETMATPKEATSGAMSSKPNAKPMEMRQLMFSRADSDAQAMVMKTPLGLWARMREESMN